MISKLSDFILKYLYSTLKSLYSTLNFLYSTLRYPYFISAPLSNETNCTYKNDDLYLYERFNDGCNICLCTPSGVICEEIKCFEEKYYLEKIDAKCAPVFAEQACCPINWKCCMY